MPMSIVENFAYNLYLKNLMLYVVEKNGNTRLWLDQIMLEAGKAFLTRAIRYSRLDSTDLSIGVSR